MTTMTLEASTVKPATLEIRNATYEARPIDPGFAGVAAVEVTKLTTGESYAVVLEAGGRATCECPDFVCRHADRGTHCKHIRGVMGAGLLVAPISGGSPVAEAPPAIHAPAPKPAFAPITEKDLARSRMFGIKLPAPAPVAEAAPEVPAEEEGSPAWTWDGWTDEFTWELGPEATEAPALVGDEVPSPVYTMPELGGPVITQPELVGLPPAADPMRWVEIGPRMYTLRNITPDAADYRERNAELDRRDRRSRGFVPTAEEQAEAAALFADRRGSCLAGESAPPVGDRGVPRRATAWPRRTFDEPRETDNYPPGYTS